MVSYMNSFYTEEELKNLGLKSYGKNVLISKKCSIYGAKDIELSDNVRIDDFCVLSGKIKIGKYVHVAAHCALYAGDVGIEIDDFSGLSGRCSLYAISDDYSGDYLIGPCVPDSMRHVISGKVILKKYSIIGAASVILPNVTIGEGTAVGANSTVTKSLGDWGIYIGSPAKWIKTRNKNLIEYAKKLEVENEL